MKIINVDFISSEPVYDTLWADTPGNDHSYSTTEEPMPESPYDSFSTIATLDDRNIYTKPQEEIIPDYLALCN